MPQNMNRFSDLLATDHRIQVTVGLGVICHNGPPGCDIRINDVLQWTGILREPITVQTQVPLMQPISLQITMYDKTYHSELETAVFVDVLEIDQIDVSDHVLPLISYSNDQCVENQSLYLGFNGTWRLQIPGPFYRWWHTASGQGWLLEPITEQILD